MMTERTMQTFTTLRSPAVLLTVDNIDTDQIIPARFLKVTDKAGLGENLFADWRYLADGSPDPRFILNQPASKQASILVVGENFGSGSSREHAAWALTSFGFHAVVAPSFADIFLNNALKNSLLPVTLQRSQHSHLIKFIVENPTAELEIDLQQQSLALPDGARFSFPIEAFAKTCLIQGVDQLGYLMSFEKEIEAFEAARASNH